MMMDSIDMERLSRLARIRLSEAEAEALGRDIAAMAAMAEELPAFEDNAEIQGMAAAPLREDCAEPDKFTRDELLASAPRTYGGYISVPRTVKAPGGKTDEAE